MPSEQPGHVVALNVLLAGIVISNTSVNFSPVFKPSVFVDPITLHKAQPCQQQKTSFTIYTPEKKKKKRGCPSQRNNCTEIGATGGLPISVQPETMRPSRQLDITELMEFHPGPMMAVWPSSSFPIGQQAKCLSVVTNITRKPQRPLT